MEIFSVPEGGMNCMLDITNRGLAYVEESMDAICRKLRTWCLLIAELPHVFAPGRSNVLLLTDVASTSKIFCCYDGMSIESDYSRAWLNFMVIHEKLSGNFLLAPQEQFLAGKNALKEKMCTGTRFVVLLGGMSDLMTLFDLSSTVFSPSFSPADLTVLVDQ